MLWSDIGTARRSEPSQLKDRGKGGGGAGRDREKPWFAILVIFGEESFHFNGK